MIKIGLLGAGHLGKIHLGLLQKIPEFELIGFFDPNNENAQNIVEKYAIPRFDTAEQLMHACDAIDIVTPTPQHASCALEAIALGKHVFVEKPLAAHSKEAIEMVQALRKTKLKGQVGHVERFNPAFVSIQNIELNPMFIEAHRLAQFNPRGTDVSVVHDLMVHDLDIILSIVRHEVSEVRASGVAVVSKTPDIANARIAFANGCVANVTASRLSFKYLRKTRLFQPDAYIGIDFLEKQAEIVRLTHHVPDGAISVPLALPNNENDRQMPRHIVFEKPQAPDLNAIETELRLFAESIEQDKPEAVPFEDGLRTLQLVEQIVAAMQLP